MSERAVRKIDVFYTGWGEDWKLGTLARHGRTTLFEYTREAIQRGIEHSPVELPLQLTPYQDFESSQGNIPGFMYDALPDGWGLLLIDRVLQSRGIEHPDAFDRLRYIGDNAMGALRFMPADETQKTYPDWTLKTLAQKSHDVFADTPDVVLRALALTGGSAQGARPKALVQYDPQTHRVHTDPTARGEPWLFKFPSHEEHKEVCAIEALYADLARAVGIDMPPTAYIDLDCELATFGVKRFDRQFDGQCDVRVPMHSMAGLLHIDFRLPGSATYDTWLKATKVLTQSHAEVQRAFDRMVFNVVFHNRDDHTKNFEWILGQDQRWRVSPAFDLTFSDGPRGEHNLMVGRYGTKVPRSELVAVGAANGLSNADLRASIDRIVQGVDTLKYRIGAYEIRPATQQRLIETVEECAARVR